MTGPGRPTFGAKKMKRVGVMLDDETLIQAKRLGDGNLSAGLRRAVARLPHQFAPGNQVATKTYDWDEG